MLLGLVRVLRVVSSVVGESVGVTPGLSLSNRDFRSVLHY